MDDPKKFFDPFSRLFLIYNKINCKWEPEPVTGDNIEELLYMTDYVKAEVQIESIIESQILDKLKKNEKTVKKELRN